MKKLIFVITGTILLLVSCQEALDKGEFGNPLLKFYGDAKDDIGYSIAEAYDGYIICGKLTVITRGENEAGETIIVDENPQFGLIKVDRRGKQQWTYTTGSDDFDEGRTVIALGDGSFVCAGTITTVDGATTHTDVRVIKLSATGELLWEYDYGDEQNMTGEYFDQAAYDMIRNPFGSGYLVVGSDYDDTRGNNPGKRDMYLLVIDDDGSYIDSYSAGYEEDEYANSVSVTPGGKFLVVGTTDQSNTGDTPDQDGLNIVTCVGSFSNLNQSNIKVYGGAEDEYVTDIVPSLTGNAIVGTREFGLDSKEGIFVDIEVQGIDLPETLLFSSFDLASNVVEIISIVSLPGGAYLAAGNTGGTEQSGDMFFMFLDSEGNNVTSPETFRTGGTGLQSVNDAIIDNDGKIVAVGTNSYENNSLVTLLKFDPWE